MSRVPEDYDRLCDEAFEKYTGSISRAWDKSTSWNDGRQCYIAGPMRSKRFFNYPEFIGAKDALEDFGWKVLMADLTEEPNEEGHTDTPLKKFMQHDLPLLCQADCVFVLPGWQNSHGARVETHLAFQLDIPVYDIMTGRDIVEVAKEKAEDKMEEAREMFYGLSKRHSKSERVHEILREAGELHDMKQSDYGADGDPFKNVRNSEDFGVPAWIGCAIRLNDKVKRLQTLATKGSLSNESAIDSFMDIIVYGAIGLVLFEETMNG